MTTAPANGGFTVTSPGFLRVWLADDDLGASGSDVWVRQGERYSLRVASFEYPSQPEITPAGLAWLPADLGGFRKAHSFDEGEEANVEGAAGFYSAGTGELQVDGETVALTAGDFYVGTPALVTFDTINFVTAVYP